MSNSLTAYDTMSSRQSEKGLYEFFQLLLCLSCCLLLV